MNITLDDTAPQLEYIGNWTDWRPVTADPDTARYFRGTFHSAWNEGSYAVLTFNGTAAWIYGTYWLNHGAYSVSLDGGNEQTFQGYTHNREFDKVLFYTGELPSGTHVVRLFNRPSRTTIFEEQDVDALHDDYRLWIDVDYAVVQLDVPDGNNVTTLVMDDSDSRITYSDGWQLRPNSETGYYNTTAHVTSQSASFTLPFRGTSIQLFGTIGPDVGNFSVYIDGRPYPRELNGTWYERRTNSPLYFISGLPDTSHELTLQNIGRGIEQMTFEFDYAVVNTTLPRDYPVTNRTAPDGAVDNPTAAVSSSLVPPTATATGAGASSSRGGGVNVGAIAGGVAGGVAALIILGIVLFCLGKRRKAKEQAEGRAAYSEKTLGSGGGRTVKPYDYATTQGQSPGSAQALNPAGASAGAAVGGSINTSSTGAHSRSTPTTDRSIMKRGFDSGPGPSGVSSTTWSSPMSDTHPVFPTHHFNYNYGSQYSVLPLPMSATPSSPEPVPRLPPHLVSHAHAQALAQMQTQGHTQSQGHAAPYNFPHPGTPLSPPIGHGNDNEYMPRPRSLQRGDSNSTGYLSTGTAEYMSGSAPEEREDRDTLTHTNPYAYGSQPDAPASVSAQEDYQTAPSTRRASSPMPVQPPPAYLESVGPGTPADGAMAPAQGTGGGRY